MGRKTIEDCGCMVEEVGGTRRRTPCKEHYRPTEQPTTVDYTMSVSNSGDWDRHREAAKLLGLELTPPSIVNGRLRARLISPSGMKLAHDVDLGSALGVVYYRRVDGKDEYRPLRYLGPDVQPEDVEAAQDALATWGIWGPAFQRAWGPSSLHMEAKSYAATSIEILRRVKVPEGVAVVPMEYPCSAYMEIAPGEWVRAIPELELDPRSNGKEWFTVVSMSLRLGATDASVDDVAKALQVWVDDVVDRHGARVLFLYVPPVPMVDRTQGLHWTIRIAYGPGKAAA